jgi:geranylgeranyl diphosphate synthase type I
VQDLGFEGRADVSPADYLAMITNKTSAIVEFAARAGAAVGGADDATAFGEFGLAVGIGFQIRDDLLGIWGQSGATGKDAADDIRRRKQSLPILLLRAQATGEERDRLRALYQQEEIGPDGVSEILAMLAAHGIERQVADQVTEYHDRAAAALRAATGDTDNPAIAALFTLIDRLATRDG